MINSVNYRQLPNRTCSSTDCSQHAAAPVMCMVDTLIQRCARHKIHLKVIQTTAEPELGITAIKRGKVDFREVIISPISIIITAAITITLITP
jgi:hypothetical protein